MVAIFWATGRTHQAISDAQMPMISAIEGCGTANQLHQFRPIVVHFTQFAFGGRSVKAHVNHGNVQPFVCGQVLMQLTQLPCRMVDPHSCGGKVDEAQKMSHCLCI